MLSLTHEYNLVHLYLELKLSLSLREQSNDLQHFTIESDLKVQILILTFSQCHKNHPSVHLR